MRATWRAFPRARPGRYVELSVDDDGHGMDDATLARVFEPFFTTKSNGTGLGLAVVHGVVGRHGGFLHAESKPGEGTSLAVYLPLSTEALPAVNAVQVAGLEGERVLVADDDAVVRKLTERMLRRLGCHVVGASDGEEALRTFERTPDAFDLVVLDVMMPKLKGPEALARDAGDPSRAEGALREWLRGRPLRPDDRAREAVHRRSAWERAPTHPRRATSWRCRPSWI